MALVTALVALGVLALLLAVVAVARSGDTTVTRNLDYAQTGVFDYRASAPESSVYGATGVDAGEPILIGVTGPVTVDFDYRLTSDASVRTSGSVAVTAVLMLPQGLTRQFSVAPGQDFDGSDVQLSGTLPVDAVSRVLGEVGAAASSLAGPATLVVRPEVSIDGTIGGRPLSTTYAPELRFDVSDGVLSLSSAGSEDGDADAALRTREAGSIDYRASTPATLPLLVWEPQVDTARNVGLLLAPLCLLLAAWLSIPLLRAGGGDATARIRSLYGSRLVEIGALDLPDGAVADVTDIDVLADLARRYDAAILHLRDGPDDLYLVWDHGMAYRYRAAAPSTDA